MRTIGFSKQEEENVYSLISSILWIGNLSFGEKNEASFLDNPEGKSFWRRLHVSNATYLRDWLIS
jgi:myosin heavy subunit